MNPKRKRNEALPLGGLLVQGPLAVVGALVHVHDDAHAAEEGAALGPGVQEEVAHEVRPEGAVGGQRVVEGLLEGVQL